MGVCLSDRRLFAERVLGRFSTFNNFLTLAQMGDVLGLKYSRETPAIHTEAKKKKD
jgi:hypothetical protein